jgi:DNA polymerase I-like protein with 3'-5' exonuclease and polymerase domains
MAKKKATQPMVGQSLLFMPPKVTKSDFKDVEKDPRLIKPDQLPFVLNWLREAPDLFIDYETAKNGDVFILGAFSKDKGARVMDFRYLEGTPVRQVIADGLSARTRAQKTIAFNIGYEVMKSKELGFELGGTPFDPCAAAYAVNEVRQEWGEFGPHTQKALCYHELKKTPKFALMVKEWLKANGIDDYSLIPATLVFNYNCEDLEYGFEFFEHIYQQVVRNKQEQLVTTDSELGAVIERIHTRGIAYDKERATTLLADISSQRKQAQQDIIAVMDGRAIDVLKDQTLVGLLFGEWKMPRHDERSGVDGDVLEWLIQLNGKDLSEELKDSLMSDAEELNLWAKHFRRHVVLENTIDLREFDKMTGTYLLPWTYEWARKDRDDILCIFPHLNQYGARTRRFSANNPNLQNVPTRTALGQLVRSVFRTRPGWTTYSMDESQIQYRSMAHYANARSVIEAYAKDPLTDFHQIVSDLMGVKRKIGKNLNFGKLFGMGIAKLMISLQCDEATARMIDAKYNRLVPELPRHRKELEAQVRQHGYVEDMFGGRRHLDPKMAHIALNTEQQLHEADLMRHVMVKADPIIRRGGGNLLLQIHDEILFELPGKGPEAEAAHMPTLRAVNHVMTDIQMKVPLRSDTNKWAPDWAHEQEVKLAA